MPVLIDLVRQSLYTIVEGFTVLYTEEKAKALAAVCGKTEFNEFLAALAIKNKDDMKKRMNCT